MKNKKEEYSFLVVSNLNTGNISFNISRRLLNFLVASFFVLVLFMLVFTLFFKDIFNKNLFIEKLIKENAELIDKNNKLRMLDLEIAKLKEFEKKVRNITTKGWDFKNEALSLDPGSDNNIFSGEAVDKYLTAFKDKRAKELLEAEKTKNKKDMLLKVVPNIMPVKGWISRRFGERIKTDEEISIHDGLDIVAPVNTPIIASSSGIVTFSGWKSFWGNVVEIDHGFGYVTKYGHCERLAVRKGDFIKSGQVIAFLGNSGRSSGPHLHFEVIKDGKNLDPEIFIMK